MLNINQLSFQYPFTPLYIKEFEKMEAYYKAEEPRVREIMHTLIDLYCFENRHKRQEDEKNGYGIVFFQGSGQESIIWLALGDKDVDFEKEFLLDDFQPIYTYYETPKVWDSYSEVYDKDIDFQQFPMELAGKRAEQFRTIAFYYFYAWLIYLWQEEGGINSGIYATTLQNNSVRTFNFLDFTSDYVTYTNINENDPIVYPYENLSIEEILAKILPTQNIDNQPIETFSIGQEFFYHIKSDNVEVMQKAIQEGFDINSEIEDDYLIRHIGQHKAYQIFDLLLQNNVKLENANFYIYSFAKNPIFLNLLKKYRKLDWVLSNEYIKKEIEKDEMLAPIIKS